MFRIKLNANLWNLRAQQELIESISQGEYVESSSLQYNKHHPSRSQSQSISISDDILSKRVSLNPNQG